MIIPQSIHPATEGVIRVAQITDTHIFDRTGDNFNGYDTEASLAAVIDALMELPLPPDLVLVTGDLVHDPSPAAYQRLLEHLGRFKWPVYCLPGNHDDPSLMRAQLQRVGLGTTREIDCGAWRILLLDSHSGCLVEDELKFLASALTGDTPVHRLIALHHHPVRIGSYWMDAMMLENATEFWTIVEQNPSLRGIIWGHIHQEYRGERGHIGLYGTPSTCVQFKQSTRLPIMDDLPPAFRLIELYPDGRIVTVLHWLKERMI